VNAETLAERAALGSLLLGGDPTREVLGWLRASDFADPWHREVCRAFRELAPSDLSAPEAVGRTLLARLGPTRAAMVRVAELIRATPVHADARVYASMVLDAALRREIAGQGVLLRAGALSAVLEGSPRPMLAVAATVHANLDAAERRWQHAADTHRADTALAMPQRLGADSVTGPRRLRGTDQALAADRLLNAHRQTDPGEIAENEAALIAALVLRPTALGPVRIWLHPTTLTNDGWRPIYTAMLHLADHGNRIDPVTVLWEARRAAADIDPAKVIARIEAGLATNPGYLARVVAADHLRLAADTAAIALTTAAENPTLDLSQVLGTARSHVAAASAAARPLGTGQPGRSDVLTLSQGIDRTRQRQQLRVEGRAG
jgi:replicative DNA helicase